tara:strand:- start:296 stop:487 length:192 start_codon:yes stop_codon:yes gene_type:complete
LGVAVVVTVYCEPVQLVVQVAVTEQQRLLADLQFPVLEMMVALERAAVLVEVLVLPVLVLLLL